MTDDTRFPDHVQDLPASARWVYRELQADGPLTITDLQHRTGLSTRGIRSATQQLKEQDAICEFFDSDGGTPTKHFRCRGAE